MNGHPCVTLLSLNVDTIAILHSAAMNGRVDLLSHEDCVEIVPIYIHLQLDSYKKGVHAYVLCFSEATCGQSVDLKLICQGNTWSGIK